MSPRVTRKAWFGPRRIGWGWAPVSWEGWAAAGAFVVLITVSVVVFRGADLVIALIVLLAALLAVCFLTGDPPG